MPLQRHHSFSRDINVGVGLCFIFRRFELILARDAGQRVLFKCFHLLAKRTSTVSSTLITPGWRSVRSFFTAFLARGSLARLAVTSKEKMLQFEPSSFI